MKRKVMDYRSAGVNISEGEVLVEWLKKTTKNQSSRVVSGIGSYSGLFQAMFPTMKEPCLAASVDGVGTKLKLASYFQSYKEVGQDLVAMCVNDLICDGARPLFFMDYYACGRLRQSPAREFLQAVKKACEESHCVLLGGETAEMPDCYTGFNFDCAGFALGVLDRDNILGTHRVKKGDRIIGVSSHGFHSNGFSLLRKIFQSDLHKWKAELLKPTALYVSLALELFKNRGLKAIAHITGGGIDNILRVLPQGVNAQITPWEMPFIFKEVKKRTGMDDIELMRTLNCGVGLVLILSSDCVLDIKNIVKENKFSVIDLGVVVSSVSMAKPKIIWN